MIDRLRRLRVRKDPDRHIKDELLAQVEQLRTVAETATEIGAAWTAVAPEQIARGVSRLTFEHGVLYVELARASDRYIVDRWLRSVGRRLVQQQIGQAIRSIRISAPRRGGGAAGRSGAGGTGTTS